MNYSWTDKQNNIFKGLSTIGSEIAGFYEAGLKFYYENIPNGAYFLMHAAREIDGGLRDVLAVDYIPDEDDKSRNRTSILFSLGSEEFNGTSKKLAQCNKKYT